VTEADVFILEGILDGADIEVFILELSAAILEFFDLEANKIHSPSVDKHEVLIVNTKNSSRLRSDIKHHLACKNNPRLSYSSKSAYSMNKQQTTITPGVPEVKSTAFAETSRL